MNSITLRRILVAISWLAWISMARADDTTAPVASVAAGAEAESAASTDFVAMDLWIVTLRTPKDVVQEDQVGPLLAEIEDLPSVIGGRDAVRELLDRLEEKHAARRLQKFRLTSLSGRTASVVAGENAAVITGSTLSDRGQTNDIQYQQIGTSLRLSPTVVGDHAIDVKIEYECSGLEKSEDIAIARPAAGDPLPATNTKSMTLNTTASIKNGGAVLVALKSDSQADDSQVMILSAEIVAQPKIGKSTEPRAQQ